MLTPIIEEIELMPMAQMSQSEWQTIADGNYSLIIYFVKCEGDAGDVPRAEAEHGAGGAAVLRLDPGLQEAGVR